MKITFFIISILTAFSTAVHAEDSRILCYQRFQDKIMELKGEGVDRDASCRAMLIAGTVGVCFEGNIAAVVSAMNDGQYIYKAWQKVNPGTAVALTKDIIQYSSYEGDFVPWTRHGVEMFRCPAFENIKEATETLADQLETTVDYGVSRVYREKYGLPFWLK